MVKTASDIFRNSLITRSIVATSLSYLEKTKNCMLIHNSCGGFKDEELQRPIEPHKARQMCLDIYQNILKVRNVWQMILKLQSTACVYLNNSGSRDFLSFNMLQMYYVYCICPLCSLCTHKIWPWQLHCLLHYLINHWFCKDYLLAVNVDFISSRISKIDDTNMSILKN